MGERVTHAFGGRKQCRRMNRSQAGRSQRGVPAEDDLHLRAVQLPPVSQSHDALLVIHQPDVVHVLPQTRHMLSGSLRFLASRRKKYPNRANRRYHFLLVAEVLQQSIQLLLIDVTVTVLTEETKQKMFLPLV